MSTSAIERSWRQVPDGIKGIVSLGVMIGGVTAPVVGNHEFGSPAHIVDTIVAFSPIVVVPEIRKPFIEIAKNMGRSVINLIQPKIKT